MCEHLPSRHKAQKNKKKNKKDKGFFFLVCLLKRCYFIYAHVCADVMCMPAMYVYVQKQALNSLEIEL